jgi:hypothetical protein
VAAHKHMAFVCSGRKLANVLQFRLLLDTLDKLASRTVLANLKGNLDHDTRQLDIGRLVECRTTRLKFKFKLVQVALGNNNGLAQQGLGLGDG